MDSVCSVVPTCIDEDHPPLYEPISCGKVRVSFGLSDLQSQIAN